MFAHVRVRVWVCVNIGVENSNMCASVLNVGVETECTRVQARARERASERESVQEKVRETLETQIFLCID